MPGSSLHRRCAHEKPPELASRGRAPPHSCTILAAIRGPVSHWRRILRHSRSIRLGSDRARRSRAAQIVDRVERCAMQGVAFVPRSSETRMTVRGFGFRGTVAWSCANRRTPILRNRSHFAAQTTKIPQEHPVAATRALRLLRNRRDAARRGPGHGHRPFLQEPGNLVGTGFSRDAVRVGLSSTITPCCTTPGIAAEACSCKDA